MDTIRFDELMLDDRLLRAVTDMGFEEPSPIQAQAIPLQMEGLDIIGQAQTGTGKTAAFGIPLLQKIDPRSRSCRPSPSAPPESWRSRWPTRSENFPNTCTESRFCRSTADQDIVRQIRGLKEGTQIVIGTPGPRHGSHETWDHQV